MSHAAILVRPFAEGDRAFLQTIMPRFIPEQTTPARELGDIARYLEQRASGEHEYPAGTELFIAVDGAGQPVGLSAIRADEDYFSGKARAYIELIAVTKAAEGTGVGRALMEHAERWARDRGLDEIALDVFASNTGAIAFYRKAGFHADFIRMSRSLRPDAKTPEATGSTHPDGSVQHR